MQLRAPHPPLHSTRSTSSSGRCAAGGRTQVARLGGQRRAATLLRTRVAAPEQQQAVQQADAAPTPQQQQQRPLAIAAPAGPVVTSLQQLPRDLANATALLEAPNASAPGGSTRVFVLGASHVSQVSCIQIKQLIRAVRPQVVMVELCKERVGLLVDAANEDRRLETWHCRKVSIEGLPEESEEAAALWPTVDQLQQLLVTRLGAAVHTRDIEADCSRLLATGLFGRARPAASPARRGEAPQFGAVKPQADDDEDDDEEEEQQADATGADGGQHSGDVALQMVPPLGSLRFVVEPRRLPLISSMEVRLDSSLKDAPGGVTAEQLQALVNSLLEAAAAEQRNKAAADSSSTGKEEQDKEEAEDKAKAADADNSLPQYLQLRAQLAAQFPQPDSIVVAFTGVESGRAEALVRARAARQTLPFVSGLEASAVDGEGLGIDSFRPQRSSVQLSPGMLLPAEAAERLAAARAARQAERVLAPPAGWSQKSSYRLWSQSEVSDDTSSQLPPNPVADTFARVMTGVYSQLQAAAGEQVGVTAGAAWRAAMEAASEVGSQQIVLGDRPSDVSQRRLAAAITAASGSRLVAALSVLVAGIVTATTHALPDVEAAAAALTGSAAAADAGLAGAAAAASLALAWPVLAPFVEVWRFSQLSGEELEEVVAIKEPLQANLDRPFYVWGEDALLSWPGAEPALIQERDAFMARVLAATAMSATCNAPAFVAEEDGEGQLVWRYLMPEGATAASAPKGGGDGAFEPLRGPEAVVAVVGSAHVRGMVKAWQESLAKPGAVDDLLRVDA